MGVAQWWLAWLAAELVLDLHETLREVNREVGTLGEVLAQQSF